MRTVLAGKLNVKSVIVISKAKFTMLYFLDTYFKEIKTALYKLETFPRALNLHLLILY